MNAKQRQIEIWILALTYVSLILLVIGCQSKDSPSSQPPPPPPAAKASTQDKISALEANLVALPQPNSYEVRLLWPISEGTQLWLLEKRIVNEPTQPLATVPATSQEFKDTDVKPGLVYNYRLSRWDGETYTVKGEATVSIPRDLELRGHVELSSVVDVSRLFLQPGTVLKPQSSYLVIDVRELVSRSGAIETFPENTHAGIGAPGRSGGTVKIHALKGTGKLTIVARGENGGDGVDGKDAGDSAADQGTRSAGGNGANGNPGGSSGKVYVHFERSSPIRIDIERIAGAGGRGGRGGIGRTPMFGKLIGPNGTPGQPGKPGIIEPFCIRIGETTSGDCDTLHWLEEGSKIW